MTWLRKGETFICFVAFAVMALTLIADVFSRLIFGSGIFGAAEIGLIGMVVVSFLGLGVATKCEKVPF